MENLYGFKEKDVLGLCEFLRRKNNRPLSEVFTEYAESSGKQKGTVRNLYYAMAKKSKEDGEFRDKYFGGKEIKVNKIRSFSDEEAKEVVKSILLKRQEGKSVRRAVGEMSKGDMKLALRFQNKYRAAMSDEALLESLRKEGVKIAPARERKEVLTVKKEINGLVERIALELRKENAILKEEIAELKRENGALLRDLSSGTKNTKNL